VSSTKPIELARRFAPPIVTALLAAACASPPSALNMTPAAPPAAPVARAAARTVAVTVIGSDGAFNGNFQIAVEKSVTDAGLFSISAPGEVPEYRLNGTVALLQVPLSFASKTADMEVAWSLTRSKDDSVAFRKAIKSTYTGGPFDSLNGATRIVMAVEAASKKNVETLLQELSQVLR
jgi:hypothetical protein